MKSISYNYSWIFRVYTVFKNYFHQRWVIFKLIKCVIMHGCVSIGVWVQCSWNIPYLISWRSTLEQANQHYVPGYNLTEVFNHLSCDSFYTVPYQHSTYIPLLHQLFQTIHAYTCINKITIFASASKSAYSIYYSFHKHCNPFVHLLYALHTLWVVHYNLWKLNYLLQ